MYKKIIFILPLFLLSACVNTPTPEKTSIKSQIPVIENIDNNSLNIEEIAPDADPLLAIVLPENTTPKNFSDISYTEFQEIDKEKNAIVIDIRTPEEVKNFSLPEKDLVLDFYDSHFQAKLAELDRSKAYLLYCRSGSRTKITKELMKKMGFAEVYDLKGGVTIL